MYDHDGDDRISRDDLQETLKLLTDGKMDQEFMEEVLTQVTSLGFTGPSFLN